VAASARKLCSFAMSELSVLPGCASCEGGCDRQLVIAVGGEPRCREGYHSSTAGAPGGDHKSQSTSASSGRCARCLARFSGVLCWCDAAPVGLQQSAAPALTGISEPPHARTRTFCWEAVTEQATHAGQQCGATLLHAAHGHGLRLGAGWTDAGGTAAVRAGRLTQLQTLPVVQLAKLDPDSPGCQ